MDVSINWILAVPWLAFLVYWGVSAIGVKKDTVAVKWWRRSWFRLFAIAVVLVLLSLDHVKIGAAWSRMGFFAPVSSGVLAAVGALLCWAGIALAIWARSCLGRNWSNHPDIKEDHELVTSGPYRFLRHPIYTGMLAALLGTAFLAGWFWIMVFIVAALVFIRRIQIEEGYMLKLFPAAYPEYKKYTKALVPFLW